MTNNINYNEDPDSANTLLSAKKMDLESGWLGKFFGAPTHCPTNIAGLLIVLLVITGIIISFFPGAMRADDYWTITVPLITLALGYVFGKNG